MDMGLNSKIAVVTASSSGLGKASAMGLAREGAKVVITGRDPERLENARAAIAADSGNDLVAISMDVTRAEDIDNLIKQVIEKFGTIHVLVNNAGGPPPGFFWETSDDEWQTAFELTLMSSIRLTRGFLPYMRDQKWGRIINITSSTVKQPINELLLSNSLRLGVIGWAKTLANQLAPEGVLVNNVCPGWTKTERVTGLTQVRAASNGTTADDEEAAIASGIPLGRLGTPEEFANMVVFMASERASNITGTTIQVDGGATAGFY